MNNITHYLSIIVLFNNKFICYGNRFEYDLGTSQPCNDNVEGQGVELSHVVESLTDRNRVTRQSRFRCPSDIWWYEAWNRVCVVATMRSTHDAWQSTWFNDPRVYVTSFYLYLFIIDICIIKLIKKLLWPIAFPFSTYAHLCAKRNPLLYNTLI